MPPADYYPVTISTNETPQIHDVVERAAARFKQLNGHEVRVIREADLWDVEKAKYLAHPRLAKTLLWDLIPSWVDCIFYYDRDVIPMRPLGKVPDCEFGAVPEDGALGGARDIWPLFRRTGLYFNSGVLVANRSSREVFDLVYALQSYKRDAYGCYDQDLFNMVAQQKCDVTALPIEWNYMVARYNYVVQAPKMVHCTGATSGYTLADLLLRLVPQVG